MNKFKLNDNVLILGDSIGGFDFKGEKGIVVNILSYEHYLISVKGKTVTYWGSKLELYTEKTVDDLILTYKNYINNHIDNFMEGFGN